MEQEIGLRAAAAAAALLVVVVGLFQADSGVTATTEMGASCSLIVSTDAILELYSTVVIWI